MYIMYDKNLGGGGKNLCVLKISTNIDDFWQNDSQDFYNS